jgi:hypothetical protein
LDQNDSFFGSKLLPKIGSNCDKKFSKIPHFLSTDFLDFWCRSHVTLRNGKFSKLSRKQKRAATRERETEREKRGREKIKKEERKKKKRKRPPKSTKSAGKEKEKGIK